MIQDISLWMAFKTVSDEKSFSAAARKLGIGLPQVSKRIQRLEDSLGVRLFQRTTRSVSPTQDGLSIYPKVTQLLEDLAEVEATFEKKQPLVGKLKVTCITSVAHKVFARTLVGFHRKYPGIEIELDVNDGVVDLIDTQTDVAIRVEGPRHADYVFKRLLPNRLIFVAAPSYLKANGVPRILRDLREHSFLRLSVYGPCRVLGTGKTVAETECRHPIACNSGMMLTTLCQEGGGVALRSVWDVDRDLSEGRLVRVLPQVRIEDFGVLNAVVSSRRLISGKVRAFLDFLEEDAKHWPR